MTEYIGAISRVAFAREGTYNTLPAAFSGGSGGSTAPRMIGIMNQAIDLPDKEVDVHQYRNLGSGRRYFDNKPGQRTRSGTLSFLPSTPEMLLYAFAGRADSTTPFEGYSATSLGGAPTTYRHVFKPANVAKLASFSVGATLPGAPDFQRIFTGCQIDSLSLSLAETGELSATLEYMAKAVVNEEQASPTLFTQPLTDAFSSPYSSTPTPYMFYDRAANINYGGSYNYSTNTYSGGRTLARVKTFDISFNNNLKPLWFTQSSNAQDVFDFVVSYPDFALTIDVVPAGKLAADTDALYDLLEAETQFDVVIPFQRPNGDTLNFIFDNCRIKTAPHGIPDDGGEVTVTLDVTVDELRIVATDRVADYTVL